MYRRTVNRGFNLKSSPLLVLNTYVNNASRPSCPSKQTEDIKDAILEKVRHNKYSKEKICTYITAEVGGVSTKTI